jgi:P-type Ca2+ transporter type 2C
VLVVVLLNAVIGFVQENRAEASLDALRRMLVLEVRVRRDGDAHRPGRRARAGRHRGRRGRRSDPGRRSLVEAVQLEVEEAALTGESLPVAKQTEPVEQSG